MKKGYVLPYWNHNAAYYPRLRRALEGCRRILDVGCGDGSLALFLQEEGRETVGIDPCVSCIEKAKETAARTGAEGVSFLPCSFENYTGGENAFDGVLFAASLHHFDAEKALQKALRLLKPGGMLCIVGCAKPSSVRDHLIEGLRVIPCFLLSRLHAMKSPEQLEIPTSYGFPKTADVRRLLQSCLPGVKVRQGLYYRYLVFYKKPFST